LHLLNTTLSINDLADAIEALHVRASWQAAAQLNSEADAARKRTIDQAKRQLRKVAR
jgi:hypothetical protein